MRLIYWFCAVYCVNESYEGESPNRKIWRKYGNQGEWIEYQCGNHIRVTENQLVKIAVISEEEVFSPWCNALGNTYNLTVNSDDAKFMNRNRAKGHLIFGYFAVNVTTDLICKYFAKRDVKPALLTDTRNVYKQTDGITYLWRHCSIKLRVVDQPKFFRDENNAILYALLGAGSVIIILLIVTYWNVCKKSRIDAEKRNKNYENLTDEAQATIPPFPRETKLEETYLSSRQEPTSANSQNPDSVTYAQPFFPNLKDLYSRPAPKNASLDPRTLYSQVVPKSQRGNSSKELTYAEIQHGPPVGGDKSANAGGAGYANLAVGARGPGAGRGDYSNVFSGPYCNTKGRPDDYAEPAYCQVNRT